MIIATDDMTKDRVINKIVLYKNSVLDLKYHGQKLNVTKIENIMEYDLEECIKVILESNPNVIFNTIQYSKRNKTAYFYTNYNISTYAWDQKQLISHKNISSSKAILREIRNVLSKDRCKDKCGISVYDFVRIMRDKYNEYRIFKTNFLNSLDSKLSSPSLYRTLPFSMEKFNFEKMELVINCASLFGDGNVIFSKKDGKLYIKESNTFLGKLLFEKCYDDISNFYDICLGYKNILVLDNNPIKSINSNFEMIMDYRMISLRKSNLPYDFKLSFMINSNDTYHFCISKNINSIVDNLHEEIAKSVFIKINNCPESLHSFLTEFRLEQLEEEKKHEIKIKIKKKI